MLMQILTYTPGWVYALFALLLWLGGRQLRAGQVPLARTVGLATAMSALSLYGAASVFGGQPLALLCWAAAAALSLGFMLQRPVPEGTCYEAPTRRFVLPGSAVPLVLMMGIFFTKYAVGVSTNLHPALVRDTAFALVVCGLYGAFCGIFAGRALRLWRLATRENRVRSSQPAELA